MVSQPCQLSRAATPLTNFEDGTTQGWQNWSNPRIAVPDPTGDSAYMLKLDVGQQQFAEWVLPNFANTAVTAANINANNRFEFDAYFPSATWLNGTAQVKVGFDSANGEQTALQQTITVTPDARQHIVIDYASLGTMSFPPNDWLNINLYIFPGTYTNGTPTYPQSLDIGNVALNMASHPQWNVNADGNWTTPSNWTTLPNGPGQIAELGSDAGVVTSARTVSISAPVTIGTLLMTGPAGYTINATGGNGLTLNSTTSGVAVSAFNGNQTINAPLVAMKDVTFNVGAGATLAVANFQVSNIAADKEGAGTLTLNHLQSVALSFHAGTLQIAANNPVANVVTALTGGGKLDLANGKLVVKNGTLGTWNGTNYTGILGLVKSGRNGGTWDGKGIITSMTAAISPQKLTTLAVAAASQAGFPTGGTFAGVSVAPADLLVMYTYAGDANLDGTINADDYFAIDSNYNKSGTVFGYANGDFNYDGKINGDDYFLIDSNFVAQGAPFSRGAMFDPSATISPVPETAPAAMLFAAGTLLLFQRRRIRGSTSSSLL